MTKKNLRDCLTTITISTAELVKQRSKTPEYEQKSNNNFNNAIYNM